MTLYSFILVVAVVAWLCGSLSGVWVLGLLALGFVAILGGA